MLVEVVTWIKLDVGDYFCLSLLMKSLHLVKCYAVVCVQAIEEQSVDMLDHSDFQNTDVPFEIPLPESLNVSVCGF